MRKMALTLLVWSLISTVIAANLTSDQAKSHIRENATVCVK